MPETLPQLFGRWGVGDLLLGHPGLALVPSPDARIIIAGDLCFRVQGPHGDPIADAYEVEIHVPRGFPEDFARVWETGGRIPESYHKLHDGSLCLGAPGELRLRLLLAPRLLQSYARGFIVGDTLEPSDAVVALAGGDGERMGAAIGLYKRGLATKLLITGPDTPLLPVYTGEDSLTQGEIKRRIAVKRGVPAESIV